MKSYILIVTTHGCLTNDSEMMLLGIFTNNIVDSFNKIIIIKTNKYKKLEPNLFTEDISQVKHTRQTPADPTPVPISTPQIKWVKPQS